MPVRNPDLPAEILLMILTELVNSSKVKEIAINDGVFFPPHGYEYHVIKITASGAKGGFTRQGQSLQDLRLVCRSWNLAVADELHKRNSRPLYWLSGFDLPKMGKWIEHVGEAEIGRIRRFIVERDPATWGPRPPPHRPRHLWLDRELPRQRGTDSKHINIKPLQRYDWFNDYNTLCPQIIAIDTTAWPSPHQKGEETRPYFGSWSIDGQYSGLERFCDKSSSLSKGLSDWTMTGSARLDGHVLLEAMRYLVTNGTQ